MLRKVTLTAAVGLIVLAGSWAYRHWTPESRDAAAMIEGTVPMSWSSNERLISTLRDRLDREPDSADHLAALGHAYLQKARETADPGLYGQAEELFGRALDRVPDHVQSLIGQSSLALSRHEFQQARDLAERAIALAPDLAASYGMLTDALTELGDYAAAIRAAERMTQLKPNISAYSRISYLRELHGDMAGAVAAMQMAVEAGSPDAENTAWCIVQLGHLYLNSGRPAEAEQAFRSALERFPKYVHAFAGLAHASIGRGDLEAAAGHYREAVSRVPLPEFLIGLGEVYLRMGRAEDAKAQLGLVEAIQQIHRSNGVQMDGDMALFEADHGGNPERALEMAAGEWSRRRSVRTADVYAWALFKSGRVHEASEMMQQALRLGTRDPLLYYHAGKIAEASGRQDEARRYLRLAMDTNPGFSAIHAADAQASLERLDAVAGLAVSRLP